MLTLTYSSSNTQVRIYLHGHYYFMRLIMHGIKGVCCELPRVAQHVRFKQTNTVALLQKSIPPLDCWHWFLTLTQGLTPLFQSNPALHLPPPAPSLPLQLIYTRSKYLYVSSLFQVQQQYVTYVENFGKLNQEFQADILLEFKNFQLRIIRTANICDTNEERNSTS